MGIFFVASIIAFGIAVSLKSANAIECYQCGITDTCNDPFHSSGVSTTSCPFACSKIKAEGSGEQDVVRGCLPGGNKCETTTHNGVKANICTCTSDLCNGVLPVAGSFVTLVASVFIYLVLML